MSTDPVPNPIPGGKYMSVPEKIELVGNSGPIGYQPPSNQRYKPMKIPDTITLGTAGSSPPTGAPERSEASSGGGDKVERDVTFSESPWTMAENSARQVQSKPEDQGFSQRNGTGIPNSSIPDIEHRLRTLENQMQRLTNTVLRNEGNSVMAGRSLDKGNGFWYVMTFTGWMMVPLIIAFMYRFRQ